MEFNCSERPSILIGRSWLNPAIYLYDKTFLHFEAITSLLSVPSIIAAFTASISLASLFGARAMSLPAAIAPPVCAPILADYFIISREKYDIRLLEKHPAFRWAGVISFIVGGAFGYLFQYVWKLPSSTA